MSSSLQLDFPLLSSPAYMTKQMTIQYIASIITKKTILSMDPCTLQVFLGCLSRRSRIVRWRENIMGFFLLTGAVGKDGEGRLKPIDALSIW